MIYLACPYSHLDSNVREYRFKTANRAAARLMRAGHVVYSPISHTHPIAMEGDLPLDWSYWQSVDEFYIRLCERVIVLMLTDWKSSKGVQAEIEIARALDKPVEFMEVEG
jgi:hypothetical protein